MTTPLISIVTVCRNSEKTIHHCIESILPILDGEVEYLIIDGASTDSTLNIIYSICNGNPNVLIKSEKDHGLYDAMNKGIKQARGEYLWYINSDDAIVTEQFSTIIDALKSFPYVDCLYGDCNVYETKPTGEERFVKVWKGNLSLSEIKHGMIFSHQAVLCRRKLLQCLGGFNQKLKVAADWDLMLRLYNSGACFHYLPYSMSKFSRGGLSCMKRHVWERHLVRKWNRCYNGWIDLEWLRDLKTICHDFLIK